MDVSVFTTKPQYFDVSKTISYKILDCKLLKNLEVIEKPEYMSSWYAQKNTQAKF